MRTLIAVVFVLFVSPSMAGVITYDFSRIVLGDDAQQSSLYGEITFDESETQFNMNTWLSFFFELEFDGIKYEIYEQDISYFEISDLNDGVYGDEGDEGFELFIADTNSTYEFSIYSGFAGLGRADTCVFDLNGNDRCAGGLFQLVKSNDGTSTTVSEPASFATAMLILFALASVRKRNN